MPPKSAGQHATLVVVLSGPVGAGKTTVGKSLTERFDAHPIHTREMLREMARSSRQELPTERRALQGYGDQLDTESDGRWVADGVLTQVQALSAAPRMVVVDAVRRRSQIEHLRARFAHVLHIHVTAPVDELERRYQSRRTTSPIAELPSYAQVLENATEAEIVELRKDADVAIDTNRCDEADVVTRAVAAVKRVSGSADPLVDVLVGGQYGSEGKGNIAYYLAGDYDLLMRVGGPNAGHKVPTNPPYTHRLLPSGTMANPNAALLIGPGATLDVAQLLKEISECGVTPDRLSIDPQAMIIEDSDLLAESELVNNIGSTGKGGGSAASRRIMGRYGKTNPVRLARDIDELKPYARDAFGVLQAFYEQEKRILLEGTQGTNLSIFHGDYPFVTSRDTTTAGCLAEAGIAWNRVRKVIMVCRTYPIRVMSPKDGTSGPMKQEIEWKTVAERSGISLAELVDAERGSVSFNERRVGEFDWELLARSTELNGATEIALTFADYVDVGNRDARRFDQLSSETIHFIDEIERVSGRPVSLVATRFDPRSVIDRRRI